MNTKKIETAEITNANGNTQEEKSYFDFALILKMIILNWQWIVLSTIICLSLAFIYLRYKSPVYQVAAKVLIKDDDKKSSRGGSQMLSNMQDFGFMSNTTGFDNELEIIRSLILAREVVKDLKLYVSYKNEGTFKDNIVYRHQPISVDIDSLTLAQMEDKTVARRLHSVNMKMWQNEKAYDLEGSVFINNSGALEEHPFKYTAHNLPTVIEVKGVQMTLTPNGSAHISEGRYIEVNISSPTSVARRYVGSLGVSPTSKTTTIAALSVRDYNSQRAEDFIRQLVVCYNNQANADKNEIALKTEEFINGRLEKISNELGMTETELEDYKKRNNLTNLKLNATETLTQASQYENRLNEAKMQIQLLNYLSEYVEKPSNQYQIIPSNVGLQDISSTHLITQFNQNVLDRNRLLQSASERSPQVTTITATLDDLQKSIKVALSQARRSAEINMQGVQRQYDQYQRRIASTPEQERILTQIGRQQEVRSGLYMMLLQKREENSISLAATADKGKLIDDPIHLGKVSPKNNIIMLLALIIGLGLPLLILFAINMLRYRIEGHDDVEKLTSLPIIADVPIANESSSNSAGIVVQENQNTQIDEIFRSMRTNIQFMMKDNQQVIMFTSSTSGEGKTFNAANLAASFAFLKKRVVLLGLDIRKPALGRLFGHNDKKFGITSLLTKNEVTLEDVKSCICPSNICDDFHLLLAGPIPPNPTELLARENLSKVIEILKQNYDYIILDTAPVGLVSDTFQIGKHADVTVYVCRADYTPKSFFDMMNQFVNEGKLNNVCLLLNGIDMTNKKYGYHYGYGRYGKYGRYSGYGKYTSYGSYGTYANSHYGSKDDNSIKK